MGSQSDGDLETRQPEGNSARSGDRVFAVIGFALAAVAAFFPWYVFLHQENFGVNPMEWGSTRDLPEKPPRTVASVSPLALPDKEDGSAAAKPFDPITTATVSDLGETPRNDVPPPAQAQEFPGKPAYRLLHVANGRALIEDHSGMYLVRIGSVLPDNSRLATMEKRDGHWVIVTSNGEVLSE